MRILRIIISNLNLTSLHRHPPKKKKKTGKNSEYGYAFQMLKETTRSDQGDV